MTEHVPYWKRVKMGSLTRRVRDTVTISTKVHPITSQTLDIYHFGSRELIAVHSRCNFAGLCHTLTLLTCIVIYECTLRCVVKPPTRDLHCTLPPPPAMPTRARARGKINDWPRKQRKPNNRTFLFLVQPLPSPNPSRRQG